MISLVETGLMNALLAVVLALPILILGRIYHRPALIHAFWILVLVKLIAPPLFLIPVRLNVPAWQPSEMAVQVAPQVIPPPPQNHTVPARRAENGSSLSRSREFAERRTGLLQPAARNAQQSTLSSWFEQSQNVARSALQLAQNLAIPALGLWFCGSIAWFTWQGWRIVRFTQVFLKYARRGPSPLQQLAQRLAQPMGISQAPEIWLLPAVVSPMLWAGGGKPRILFPTDLLARLDEGAMSTLLTHELAHYRRGDHRVRMLEFLASGLFWWHPVIWLARRELEISEEKCCDAWVVSQFPAAQRKYADALLTTVDFLTEVHPPLPAIACGLGEVPLLRQRLKLIMCGTAPKSLSLLGRTAVVATAMLLPISPSLRLREPAPALEAATPTHALPLAAKTEHFTRNARPATTHATAAASRLTNVQPLDVSAPGAPVIAAGRPGYSPPNSETTELQVPADRVTSDPGFRPLAKTSELVRRLLGRSRANHPSHDPDWDDLFDFLTCHTSNVVFLADGEVSMTGLRDGTIRVWNLQNSDFGWSLDVERMTLPADYDDESSCAPRDATAAEHSPAAIWQVNEQRQIEPVTMSPRGVNSLSVSPCGLTLAASVNGWLTSRSLTNPYCELEHTLTSPPPSECAVFVVVRFTASGKLLIATDWNGTLVTWDLGSRVTISK